MKQSTLILIYKYVFSFILSHVMFSLQPFQGKPQAADFEYDGKSKSTEYRGYCTFIMQPI